MAQVNIHDAKTNLSKLIEKAVGGEDIIIARAGKPVVRLVPVEDNKSARTFGILKGEAVAGKDFFDPLPESELKTRE